MGPGMAAVLCSLPWCLRNKRLGWWDMTVLWDTRDPEAGTQSLEMDNQGFWAPSEKWSLQSLELAPVSQSWSFEAQLLFLLVTRPCCIW